MREEFTTRESSILMPILLSSIAGASLAFLISPKSGREIRQDLKRLASSTREQVSEAIDKGIEKSKNLYEQSKTAASSVIESGKNIAEAVGEPVSEAKEKLEAAREEEGPSVIMPVLVGSLIGASLALLFAPKSGTEIRSDLREFGAKTREKISDTVDKGKNLYEQAKMKVTGAAEEGARVLTEEKEKMRAA